MQSNTKRRIYRRLQSTFSQHWQMLLMALPAVALLFMFSYMPMFGTLIAFKRYKVKLGILGSKWMDPLQPIDKGRRREKILRPFT